MSSTERQGVRQAPGVPSDPASLAPEAARRLFAEGLTVPTSGWCAGYAQANIIAVPRGLAFETLLFAQRNPKPCPILDVLDAGEVRGGVLGGADPGSHADIRTDVPLYRVYERGELVAEVADARGHWRDDLVTFLVGCSFTFEHPLLEAGVPVRHLTAGRNVPMYVTSRQCRPAGQLSGPLVVSMRGVPSALVADAVRVTSRYPAVHGAPVHVGDPGALGIGDLAAPDFGDPPVLEPGDVPVFWACGVTPQAMVMESRPEIAITHAPGHMLITDARDSAYAVP
ncbi:putative hydro-lyase [Intrasporangium calvum]|uniref:Putative hydro-lyase OO014_07335 n=1 Tax=Intrasporangium calvum TaxID=53358 RepID=A0ABT5GG35_9MICO|nr:putative hydro-lyase [Intrasporangium calvum]MDC5697068.1 putative hydro-lyase [Intrasporangium calvum]